MLQFVSLESAFGILLNQIAFQITSHSVCILSNIKDANVLHLKDFPTIISSCEIDNYQQLLWGVNHGCAFFMVSQECTFPFLELFNPTHDQAIPKFSQKVLLVVDDQKMIQNETILKILEHDIVKTAIPQTLIVQPNKIEGNAEDIWINVWSAFPFSKARNVSNKYFLSNESLEFEKPFVSYVTDLDKIEIRQGVFDYAPYTKKSRVPPGKGNANVYGSPESPLSAKLQGLESTIIIEFCRHYNCIVSARLDYDVSLWGWGFGNRTGTGVLGAITKYDIDLTGCGCFIMGNRYNWMQYTVPIQQSMITHFLPKPKPMPYLYTPVLPFPMYTWIAVFGAFIFGAIFVFIVSVAALKTSEVMKGNEEPHNLVDSIFTVLKMNLLQNVRIRTNLWSKTLMMATLLTSSLIIGNLYAGGLARVMTVTPYESPVDSVEKLVETDLLWGETSITWIMAIMESTYPAHQKYVAKFIEEISLQKIHSWVSEQRMAVIVQQMQARPLVFFDYVDRNDSKFLMIMKQPLYFQYTAILTTKTWPWIDQLNRIVFMQQESGIWKYWAFKAAVSTTDYAIQRNMEENSKNQENMEAIRLSVPHILGPLFLMFFGYFLAVTTFIIEIIWEKHVKKVTLRNTVESMEKSN